MLTLPERVKRGEQLKGRCEINLGNEVSCREIVVSLECFVIYNNPCVSNFGEGWSQMFRTTAGLAGGKLRHSSFDFQFSIPPEAPPTYAGTRLSCRWQVKTKIDIPWAFDINQARDVVVER